MRDGTPDDVQQAYLAVTGGARPSPTPVRNPARRAAGALFAACAVVALVNTVLSTTTPLRLVAGTHAALFAVAAVVLLVGRGGVGAGLGTAVGFMVFGEYVALLSFHATDRFAMLTVATAALGLVAGVAAARDRTPSVRSGTPLGWSLAAVLAGFGTVTAADLPWYHLGGDGLSVDCCAITGQSGWPLVATFARLFVLALLLVSVVTAGRTTRSTGGYLGIALAGLVSMVWPVYEVLSTPGMSPEFGIWLAAAAFLPPLLYGLAGLRRSLPPPTVVAPARAWRPPVGGRP